MLSPGQDDATLGADLDELLRIGTKVNSVTRTMGMALTSCTPPAKGSPLFELGDDEMEMGVGIHGEPGRRREKLASANEIVDEQLAKRGISVRRKYVVNYCTSLDMAGTSITLSRLDP